MCFCSFFQGWKIQTSEAWWSDLTQRYSKHQWVYGDSADSQTFLVYFRVLILFHLFSPEVYQRGQASPSLVLRPPWNRQNLHHPRLCQAAVQGQRVQLHGVGGELHLLITSFWFIWMWRLLLLFDSLIWCLTIFVLQLNASDDRGIDVVRGPILSFASTRTIFK